MDPAANGLEEGIQSIGDLLTQRQRKRFQTGDTLLGRYRILGELGQGGMGLVFRCMDEIGGIEVAVKMLPPEVSHDSGEMEDVRENFRLVSSLVHQNICAVRTLEKDPATGEYFLVMELAQGVNLRQWRKGRALSPKAPGSEGRDASPRCPGSGSSAGGVALPLEQILPIVRQIAAALDYAHEHKVIHRDIKPSNVMVDTSAFGLQSSACTVKVLDSGLAAQIHTSFSRVSHVRYGTSGTGPYMAPEQWEGQYQDAATDQYALAVLTYELLTGHCPFESHEATVLRESVLKSAPRCPPGLPPAAWEVLKRGLAKERDERFASCGEFARALAGEKIPQRNTRNAGKGGGWKWAAAVALLAALAAGAIWFMGRAGPPDPPGSAGKANPPGEPELGLNVGGGVDSARLEGRALSRKAPGTEEEDGALSQPALPPPEPAVDYEALVDLKAKAEQRWERVQALDSGQGFGAAQDGIGVQMKAAADCFRDEKKHALALKKYTAAVAECDRLQALDEVRYAAKQKRSDAENAQKEAQSAGAETDAEELWGNAGVLMQDAGKIFEGGQDFSMSESRWSEAAKKFDQAAMEARGAQEERATEAKRQADAEAKAAAEAAANIAAEEATRQPKAGFVTVLGRVKTPGRVAIPGTCDMTVSSAIQKAGGFGPSAKDRAILVTRSLPDGQTETRTINLRAVGTAGRLEDDIILEANDVVFVPESMF